MAGPTFDKCTAESITKALSSHGCIIPSPSYPSSAFFLLSLEHFKNAWSHWLHPTLEYYNDPVSFMWLNIAKYSNWSACKIWSCSNSLTTWLHQSSVTQEEEWYTLALEDYGTYWFPEEEWPLNCGVFFLSTHAPATGNFYQQSQVQHFSSEEKKDEISQKSERGTTQASFCQISQF